MSTLNLTTVTHYTTTYLILPYSELNRLKQIQTVLLVLFLKPPSSLTPLLFLNLYTGSKSISILSIKFFLLHKALTTAQPGYLRNLISVDSTFIVTRSSSSVNLSRPSSSSSIKITDRSFHYVSPCLWNKLPASFHQPNPDHSFSHSSQPNSLYKIIHELSTFSSNTFFEFSHNGKTRGHSLKLQKKRVLTDLRKHFFQKG